MMWFLLFGAQWNWRGETWCCMLPLKVGTLLPKGSFLHPTSAITSLLYTSIPDGSKGWFGGVWKYFKSAQRAKLTKYIKYYFKSCCLETNGWLLLVKLKAKSAKKYMWLSNQIWRQSISLLCKHPHWKLNSEQWTWSWDYFISCYKLASLEAMLVQIYDWPTQRPTDGGEVYVELLVMLKMSPS